MAVSTAAGIIAAGAALQCVISDVYTGTKALGGALLNSGYNIIEIDVKEEPLLARAICEELTRKLKNDGTQNYFCVGNFGQKIVFKPALGRYTLVASNGNVGVQYGTDRILVYQWRVLHLSLPKFLLSCGVAFCMSVGCTLMNVWEYVRGRINFLDIADFSRLMDVPCFLQNNIALKQFIEDVHAKTVSPTHFVSHYGPQDDRWRFVAARKYRTFDQTKFTDKMKQFFDDVQNFTTSEQNYKTQGHHYRKGYLLVGPPGCGKTSSVEIVATRHQLPVYSLNLAGSKMCNEHLSNLTKTLPPRCVLLFDEIDKQCQTLAAQPKKNVSFDELLSSLDGVVPLPTGCIVVMTANDDNFLTPTLKSALLRPGRIDEKIEFTEKYL